MPPCRLDVYLTLLKPLVPPVTGLLGEGVGRDEGVVGCIPSSDSAGGMLRVWPLTRLSLC